MTITIHITDQPDGSVLVQTTAGTYAPKIKLTPAKAIAYQLLNSLPTGIKVHHWHAEEKAINLVRQLLDPEGFGFSVTEEVRRRAAEVLATTGEQWHHFDPEAAA